MLSEATAHNVMKKPYPQCSQRSNLPLRGFRTDKTHRGLNLPSAWVRTCMEPTCKRSRTAPSTTAPLCCMRLFRALKFIRECGPLTCAQPFIFLFRWCNWMLLNFVGVRPAHMPTARCCFTQILNLSVEETYSH